MSQLYPSLEDMKVDQMVQAQQSYAHQAAVSVQAHAQQPGAPSAPAPSPPPGFGSLYPSLQEYMGLNLTDEVVQANMPNALTPAVRSPADQQQVAVVGSPGSRQLMAPLTATSVGYKRAEVTHGIREVILCKDGSGKVGLRVRSINKGIFVTLVHKDSPAALSGLRFGDQILQINGDNTAGWDTDKAMDTFKKAKGERIVLAVRDRPFERTITMHKDSNGHIGFVFDEGRITKIVKDSSAARNGILTEHNLLEINGQNMVGLKDSDVVKIFSGAERTVTITIMPSFVYDHMMKCMKSNLVKKSMDHSIPDI